MKKTLRDFYGNISFRNNWRLYNVSIHNPFYQNLVIHVQETIKLNSRSPIFFGDM